MISISTKNKAEYGKRQWVQFINSLSGAKSANLIGTISPEKTTNLAIISSVFHLGASPALMGFILRPHSNESPRHTLMNIQDMGYYTINHVHSKIYRQAHQTSARYDRNISEFQACGLTESYKEGFAAPFVEESQVQIGLELREFIPIRANNTHMVIGEILWVHLKENLQREDGSLDLETADTLAVTGLDSYHQLRPLGRLTYAKPNQEPQDYQSPKIPVK